MLRVSSVHKTTVDIDGEPVKLKIAKLTIEQWTAFIRRFQLSSRELAKGNTAHQKKRRELIAALPREDVEKGILALWKSRKVQAQLKAEQDGTQYDEAFVDRPTEAEAREAMAPSDVEVTAAVEADMTPAELAAKRQRDVERAQESDEFTKESIAAYITVEPEQIWNEDSDAYVLKGAELVQMFGSREDILTTLLSEIFLMNRLSETDKKKLLLGRASRRSSVAVPVVGATPAPTATSAEPAATASSEAVTVERV